MVKRSAFFRIYQLACPDVDAAALFDYPFLRLHV